MFSYTLYQKKLVRILCCFYNRNSNSEEAMASRCGTSPGSLWRLTKANVKPLLNLMNRRALFDSRCAKTVEKNPRIFLISTFSSNKRLFVQIVFINSCRAWTESCRRKEEKDVSWCCKRWRMWHNLHVADGDAGNSPVHLSSVTISSFLKWNDQRVE